jgi:hypothetical protein
VIRNPPLDTFFAEVQVTIFHLAMPVKRGKRQLKAALSALL